MHLRRFTPATLVVGLLAMLPVSAFADELNGADTAWILTATALVLFMTIPGLSLFYAGLVRVKNVLSVLMQCFAITCLVSIIWLVYGYSLALAEGNAFIGGLGKLFHAGVTEETLAGNIPETLLSVFQLTFAIITPALIVGAFAERMRFAAMLVFSAIWVTLVYFPLVHWVWGGGWLGQMGVIDFAGGIVVHISAGVAALVCALVMGPRRGFPTTPMQPHNMTMAVTGAGMLWVGWFGFNGGSALAANGDATMAVLVTHISAATGAFTWMCWEWKQHGKPSALGIVTGMVAGLGTITPASGSVGPAGALVIGLCAGTLCYFMTNFMKRRLGVDDSLDVFPVHGIGGMLGTFLVAIFASPDLGIFSGQGFGGDNSSIMEQMTVQVIGIVASIVYVGVLTLGILKVTAAITPLRVNEEEETEGLDLVLHDEQGYKI